MNLNRQQLQRLSELRIAEAQTLLSSGHWAGAFYLAGYAVECGLKACIARLTKPDDFPNKNFARDCYTHDIESLVKLAELQTVRDIDNSANPSLEYNWQVVKRWTETSRYELTDESQASEIVKAVADPDDGVLPWIMARW